MGYSRPIGELSIYIGLVGSHLCFIDQFIYVFRKLYEPEDNCIGMIRGRFI
jgi:hypothetical protein